MNIFENEPVVIGAIVAILAPIIAKFGFHVSNDTLTTVATVAVAVIAGIVRHFVTPAKNAVQPIAPPMPPPVPPPGK